MNTIKKSLSVLLAVMMIFSMLTVVSVSAAETTNTITVSSNLADDTQYTYDENDSQVVVTYRFQSDYMLINAQGTVTYDNTVLQLADTNTAETCMPILSAGSDIINFDLENKVKFNSTSLDLYDFTTEDTLVTLTFDIIGSGDTTVDLTVDVITATTAKTYDDILAGATDIDLVYFDEIMADDFSLASAAEVISEEIPETKVSIFGDINLELTEEDTNLYSGSINLDAGTYTYKVKVDDTEYGYNGQYTDTIAGIPYSSSYKAYTTFTATGGKYTFRFNTNNNMLTIKCKPYSELVELFGDINVELFKATDTVFSGSARLDAGEYTFRINEMGQQMCFGYTFTDSVVDIEYKDSWTGATTFVATGGIYTINYNTDTNKLTFMHAPKGLGEVRVFGSLGLDLAVENGTSYYSATTSLAAGEYTFRIDELGTTMCFGGKFTDSIYEYEYKSEWKGASTFTATGGKYTFRYNAETNKLTISRAEIEQKVSIFGDINLDLATTDDVVYTGVVTLEAGTYSFRIDDFGTTYCYGGTFKNSIDKVYSSSYKSATVFEANGGDYKFTYNKNTHRLTVLSVA